MIGPFESAARRLPEAYVGGAVPPLRDVLAPTDGDGAYRVQAINTRVWQEAGRRIVGRKIGLTARAVQVQLGVTQSDVGALFDDIAVPDGGVLDPARVIQPRAEAEVPLVLARDLDNPKAAITDVIGAVAYVLPAIEIVDSRIADWKITFADTVADNGSSAFFGLGTCGFSLGKRT